MHGASARFGGTLALRPLEFSPLHVKTLGACRSGKKKLTVRHSRASKVSVRHCRPVPCVQFLLLVASVNGWSRAQRLCRSSVAQATCELSVVWKGMSVEFLMDVVPEGGVRDHLVVTSRWPCERVWRQQQDRRGGAKLGRGMAGADRFRVARNCPSCYPFDKGWFTIC
jgi:hypothetical protein